MKLSDAQHRALSWIGDGRYIWGDNPHRLAAIQSATGLGPEALAMAIGVAPTTMRQWRTGAAAPRASNLDKIAAMEAKVAAGEMRPWPERIRAIREALGLTQEALAKRLGVRVETVSRWESGGRTPRATTAAALEGLEARAKKKTAGRRP